MKKDAFYFPHFSNARHDRKLKRIIKDLGLEGYGIFFMLLEVLREQVDFKFPYQDIDLLADEFHTSVAKIEVVLNKYELFQFDREQNFFSTKFIFYLQPYIEKTERARAAAKKRWDDVKQSIQENKPLQLPDANAYTNADANVMPEQCVGNASKVKESKEKDIYVQNFNYLWSFYPKKEGKGKVSETQKEKLYKIPQEEMLRAIERYKAKIKRENIDSQFVQMGSTFFNSGYVDYLDENYSEPEKLKDEYKNPYRMV